MEKGDSSVKLERRHAVLDVWVEMIGTILALDSAGDEKLSLPVSDGRYFLRGRDYLNQTGYNDFEIPEGRSLGLSEPDSR